MNWIQCLSKAIRYIETHLTDDISVDEISNQAYTSSSHFQLIFHLVMGLTVGEYIRNRRLSLAAQELLQSDSRIIDIAFKYGDVTMGLNFVLNLGWFMVCFR